VNNAITSVSVSSASDQQIVANVAISASTPAENATITVTSNGYNGQGFISNQGNSPSSPSATVPVNPASFNVSGVQEITDGEQGSFSIAVTSGTASGYHWSFSAPSAAGNSPNVNFTTPNAASTNTDGHWFALPNNACPPNPTAQNFSIYTITGTVTFSAGGSLSKSTFLNVLVPAVGGRTYSSIQNVSGLPGMVADNPDGTGTWHVSGTGSLARVVPTNVVGPMGYEIFVPTTSQFYNKVFQHEQVHVASWIQGPGHLMGDLYVVQTYFAQLADLTGTSQDDLTQKIIAAKATLIAQDHDRYMARKNQGEHDALAVSDPINPQYLYQNCGVY
jgi:hypothetical protein